MGDYIGISKATRHNRMEIAKVYDMGINSETEITATLQIGPTTEGMVRLFVQTDSSEIPFDFGPEEADDIAAEITAAAARARLTKNKTTQSKKRKKR